MKASDMDKGDLRPRWPEATPGTWLGAVGAGLIIVLACTVWTFWT
jgi:hypothetical protein